jgi:hypothetical protein
VLQSALQCYVLQLSKKLTRIAIILYTLQNNLL